MSVLICLSCTNPLLRGQEEDTVDLHSPERTDDKGGGEGNEERKLKKGKTKITILRGWMERRNGEEGQTEIRLQYILNPNTFTKVILCNRNVHLLFSAHALKHDRC